MAFNPAIRTERTVVGEDRSWCATKRGWDTCRSITLDVSTFTDADNIDGRVIYSGIALGQITATGLYAPYDPDASDGTETGVGFLFTSVQIDDDAVATANDVFATLLYSGDINEGNLRDFGSNEGMVDAAFKVDVGDRFYWR